MKTKYHNMDKVQILNRMFRERNLSESTQTGYWRSVNYFEKLTGKTLPELLEIADNEELNNIRWKNCQLRQWLIDYREHLYQKYKTSTAKLYLTAIITIFRHYEITVETLPYFSTKHSRKPIPINPDELVDRALLNVIIGMSPPLLKAIVLLMSSSGISRIDTLNLTVQDYLDSTYEAHKSDDPNTAIMKMSEIDVIPTWNITRQKTGVQHYTFSSAESTRAINNYLMTRLDLEPEQPLFKVHPRHFSQLFKDMNDELGLGRNGQFSRFAPHMLRRYHATQLAEAGMNTDYINILQGRKPQGIAYTSYVKLKPSKLRNQYIEALPYIVIEDVNKIKSELDVTKQQLEVVTSENIELKSSLDDILDRIEKLEKGD